MRYARCEENTIVRLYVPERVQSHREGESRNRGVLVVNLEHQTPDINVQAVRWMPLHPAVVR